MLEKLIFDRSQQDVTNKTEKGYWNVTDVQRIVSYINYLSQELNLSIVQPDVSFGKELTREKMQAILDNINTIRNAWYVASDAPATPFPLNWNYEKANRVERILQDLYDFAVSAQKDVMYSGTFVAGSHIKLRG